MSHTEEIASLNARCTSLEVMVSALASQLEDLTAKVEGRNKSAPTKRNMTDADALRVLTGDMAALNHKDAANAIGLTYAQVYSCRGAFTFKHVIHDLEKGDWKNPWEKSQGSKK